MTTLRAEGLVLGYGRRTVVHGVTLEVTSGELVALVGPNGSGKSTLLRGLARLHRPEAGKVTLDGADLFRLRARAVARQLAVLPQQPRVPADLTVRELVWRGRYPHQGLLQRATPADIAAVQRAMDATATIELADRPLIELSGGEQQRAWIALALAQEPHVLLLDEPTSSLDIGHQVEVMQLLRELVRGGMAVAVVLHDLTLAARYADRIVAVRDGVIAFDGPPGEVLEPRALEAVFGVPMLVLRDPTSGAPVPLAVPGASVPARASVTS
jgi:iron complex transport system ATP-binding protein